MYNMRGFGGTRFDVAGEGACMKRYTDPSFYKTMCTGSVFKGVCHQSRFEKVQPT
jgi:hypothetical protein